MLLIVIPALLLLVERAQAATPSKEIPAIPGCYASAVIIALSTSAKSSLRRSRGSELNLVNLGLVYKITPICLLP